MLKAVFFDLDGTLLPMDEGKFIQIYSSLLAGAMAPYGYEAKELISVIWEGTFAMMKNTSDKTNEEVFWNIFYGHYGEEKKKDYPAFENFYLTDFVKCRSVAEENQEARKIIDFCRSHVEKVILATNPVFPMIADEQRLSFIGLKGEDFDYITAYENSFNCKPNPQYFVDLLTKFGLKPEEVILFGNNEDEDYLCARKAGIDAYLVGHYILRSKTEKLNLPVLEMKEVIPVIEKEIENRKQGKKNA